jgi:predicted deacetylase
VKQYHVELHDVRRGGAATARAMLALVPDEARALVSWLVVPRWHNGDPIDRNDPLVQLIDPAHLVLHGFTHLAGPSAWNRTWYGTEDEGEFRELDQDAAAQRIERGCHDLQQTFGVAPRWFCAPRWQLATPAAAVAAGLGVMTRDALVTANGACTRASAIWFDHGTRRLSRLAGGLHVERRISQALTRSDCIRITLHPRDLEYAAASARVRELFARLDADRWMPCSLDDAVAGGAR